MTPSRSLTASPEPPDATPAGCEKRALEFLNAGRDAEARRIFLELLAVDPAHPSALHCLGLIAYRAQNFAEAADFLRRAIEAEPGHAPAYSNLSAILRAAGHAEEAIMASDRAIGLDPGLAIAHSNRGNALEDRGMLEAALAAYEEAARLDPYFAEAATNAANVLRKLGRHAEAFALCRDAMARRPDSADIYFKAGLVLRELSRPQEAIAAYRQAIALQPRFAEVYCNLGNLLLQAGAVDEAIAAFKEALALKPASAEAACNLGVAYDTAGRIPDAIAAYRQGLALQPGFLGVRIQLDHLLRAVCDWENLESEEALLAALATHQDPVPPFATLSMAASPALQFHVAQLWTKQFRQVPRFTHAPPPAGERAKRLRIGYLSGDFHRHATAHLMVELFERHDRARVEIFAYSTGIDDKSEMRHRLTEAFDHFVDLGATSNEAAAQRIKDDGIDILVDLKGYTKQARTEIAARRPAPIQASLIGFPGTMAADFIDYVIADPHVLPDTEQPFYAEKIVHLPHCYQPNDSGRQIAAQCPTRAACGLPEQGFVFCCFNNSYKITPQMFALWMRLLAATPGSVLWLIDANPLVQRNLRAAAARHGADPARLVFARKLGTLDHLARHRLADLFLDTLPYNAHTTASDALWAGLPVLTCKGATFAGRVAASLLHAVSLPELVTDSLEDYEALALRLAHAPAELFQIRTKLLGNRASAPLFDIRAYARDLEAAFTHMWERHVDGLAPASFAVGPTSSASTVAPSLAAPAANPAACPLCDCPDATIVAAAGSAAARPAWKACAACGHVFSEASGEDLPEAEEPVEQSLGYDIENQRLIAARLVSRAVAHGASGAWLDIACGHGALLFTAAEFGFTPVALDQPAKVAALAKLGIEAYAQPIDALMQNGRFGVISLIDLLPKLPQPRVALAAARRLLRSDGLLLLAMPNMDTMVWRLMEAAGVNPYWTEPTRLHQFSRARLARLLAAQGFAPIDYRVGAEGASCMEVIARVC